MLHRACIGRRHAEDASVLSGKLQAGWRPLLPAVCCLSISRHLGKALPVCHEAAAQILHGRPAGLVYVVVGLQGGGVVGGGAGGGGGAVRVCAGGGGVTGHSPWWPQGAGWWWHTSSRAAQRTSFPISNARMDPDGSLRLAVSNCALVSVRFSRSKLSPRMSLLPAGEVGCWEGVGQRAAGEGMHPSADGWASSCSRPRADLAATELPASPQRPFTCPLHHPHCAGNAHTSLPRRQHGLSLRPTHLPPGARVPAPATPSRAAPSPAGRCWCRQCAARRDPCGTGSTS